MTAPPARPHEADRHWSATEVAVAAVAFALAVIAVTTREPRPPTAPAFVATAVFFTLVAGGYLALGVEGVRHSLRVLVDGARPLVRLLAGPALLLVTIVAYAVLSGLPVLPRLAAFGAYLLLPPLLLWPPALSDAPRARVPVRELAVVLMLWLPIEWHLLPGLPLPAPNGFGMGKLVGLVDAMYLFLVARPLSRIGFTYRLGWRHVEVALIGFFAYAVIALPIGFATQFLTWEPRLDAVRVLLGPLVIYLVTGIPEEFLFRGLLQNLLTRELGDRAGLGVASVVFGLAHLPDPRYALLAAIAGVAYGWVYQRTGKITASAITHALVDGVWGVMLGG